MAAETTTTSMPATVTISTEAILEAVAALYALARFDEERGLLASGDPCETEVSVWAYARGDELQRAAFGDQPEDDSLATWPPYVESDERANRMVPELLDLHGKDIASTFTDRADSLRRRPDGEEA